MTLALADGISNGNTDATDYQNDLYIVENTLGKDIDGRNIVILSNDVADSGVSNIKIKETFDDVETSKDVLVFGNTWIKNIDADYISEKVKYYANSGNPIISLSRSSDFLYSKNTGLASSYSADDDIRCIYYDVLNDVTYCYGTSGCTPEESLKLAYAWAEEVLTESSSKMMINSSDNGFLWSQKLQSSHTQDDGNFGRMNIKSFYSVLEEDDDGKSFVLTEYQLQGVPFETSSDWDNWIGVSGMEVSTQVGNYSADLLTYGPSSSSGGSRAISVNLSANVSINDIGAAIGKSWSYNVPDLTVRDRSDFSLNKFSTVEEHFVGDEASNKSDTLLMEPGKIVSTSGNDGQIYDETDYYSVTFYKDRTLLPDQHSTISKEMIVSF
ncbi:MAG: hypothetical protein LBJ20_04535 [Candidatus Methanoplasma sp.]|nr:hypothetical protein [Candidatus Methanoplasma sp.]